MSLSADANDSAGQVPVLEDSPVQTEQDRSNDNGSDHQAPNEHAGVINSSRGQTPVPSGEGTENGRGVQTSSEDQKMSDLTRLTKEIWDHENARVKRWRNEINSLLTFAGLFAAVVTGFGVQYYTMMQQPAAPDYNTQILERISLQLAGLVNQTNSNPSQPLPSSLPPFDIPEIVPAHAYVAALWFAALVCGLAAASIAILVNQWVNNLLTPVALSGTGSHEQLRVWNLRHQTFRSWGLAVFIDIPSVLLQVALILFLVGLVGYLWQLSVKVAMPALVLVAVLLLFLSVTTIIPVFLAYSPFISPQSLFLRWICVPIKLTFYGSMARFFSCLWVKSQLTYINGYLGSLMDQLQKRLDDLQALRVYGYYGWATEETAYLRSEAGQAIDKTMIANAFSLVKDYNILLPLIHSSLKEMQPDVAFSNVITICKRRPPVLDGDDVPRWQHDIRDDNIFVDMGKLVADLIAMRTWSTNQDADKKSLDEALDAFDNSLGAVRDDTNGIQVYMCLFDFLRNKDLQDTAIVTRVLTLIYNYDNFFSISADTDIERVKDVNWWTYTVQPDLSLTLIYTALALEIFTQSVLEDRGWALVLYALDKLQEYLKDSLQAVPDREAQKPVLNIPRWSDYYLKVNLHYLIHRDVILDHPEEQAFPLLETVLNDLRSLIGEDEFNKVGFLWSFQDLLRLLHARLKELNEPEPISLPAEQEVLDSVDDGTTTEEAQLNADTKETTQSTGFQPHFVGTIRDWFGCSRHRVRGDVENSPPEVKVSEPDSTTEVTNTATRPSLSERSFQVLGSPSV